MAQFLRLSWVQQLAWLAEPCWKGHLVSLLEGPPATDAVPDP